VVSVERGYDPRDFILTAFGGAGALHAVKVAKDLGIRNIMIPSNTGILSAVGLLVSDIRSDYVKTNISDFNEENIDMMNNCFQGLVDEGNSWLNDEKIPESQRVIIKHADMRYFGQNFELSITVDYDKIDENNIDEIKKLFHREHKREYGYCREDARIQIVNFRTTAFGKVSTVKFEENPDGGEDASSAIIEERDVYFEETNGYVPTKIYNRDALKTNNTFMGPAVIEQMDATIVIPPGHKVTIDRYHNVMVSYVEDINQ
jgi:N-methylhydantoinase A